MKILTNRTVRFNPIVGQLLEYDDGTTEYDSECTQTTAILTAEATNGKAAKDEAGTWVPAPGPRNHDWETNLLGFHVGLTMIGSGNDGKHIYDYTVVTPTGVVFWGNGKKDALHVPPHWQTIRVAAEMISWICIGEDDGVTFSDLNPEQWNWMRSADREGASADIDKWIEIYNRNGTFTEPKKKEKDQLTKLDEMAEFYATNYIHANQSGLVTHLLEEDSDYLSWEDITNLHPDTDNMGAEAVAAYIEDEMGEDWRGIIDLGNYDKNDGEVQAYELDDDDIDFLRQHIKDNASPYEIYEWWLVDEWLTGQLENIGEPTLTDGSSHWWGRTCTGQRITMDGTLQRIAENFVQLV